MGGAIYCDPPYAGTTSYGGLPKWDAEAFWSRARQWVDSGCHVFVSEYAAPSDWMCVWERSTRASLKSTDNTAFVTERLFTLRQAVASVPVPDHWLSSRQDSQ